MIWLWLIPVAWTVALLVVYARRRPPATYAPMPKVTDTTTGLADRSRSERLSEPYDWDAGELDTFLSGMDDGPDAA